MDFDLTQYSLYTNYFDSYGIDELPDLSSLLESEPIEESANLEIQDWPFKSDFQHPENSFENCLIASQEQDLFLGQFSPQSEASTNYPNDSTDEDYKPQVSKPAQKKRKRSISGSSSSSDEENGTKRRKRSQNRTSPNIVHWLLELLKDPQNEDMIAWTDSDEGEFKIVSQEKLGAEWGVKKQNSKMTYNNVA